MQEQKPLDNAKQSESKAPAFKSRRQLMVAALGVPMIVATSAQTARAQVVGASVANASTGGSTGQ